MKKIKGLKYWNEEKRYCNQNNNVVEKIRRVVIKEVLDDLIPNLPPIARPKAEKLKNEKYLKWWWKETCSMESIYTCLDCMGEIDTFGNPEWMNIEIDPSAFMAMHINDSKNDHLYQTGDAMDNRYIYSLSTMLIRMGYRTRVIERPNEAVFSIHLPENHGIVINIPGHYSAAIAWDFKKNELIWHNVNPDDKRNKRGGKFERLKVGGEIEIKYALVFWR